METLWFWLIALMIVAYVILDGYDLGAGIVHLFVAKTDDERRQVIGSIRPLWDGNEVWLIAGGGTLYFAFPKLYASSFSGLYLALMIVLWLLMLRGISIEFRSLIQSPAWRPLWDVVFGGSSALLAIVFGAALGNVVRGVPLDQNGNFFLALWTDFKVGPSPGILDWYTIIVALTAGNALLMHGAIWVAMRTTGAIEEKAKRLSKAAWWPLGLLIIAITVASFSIQPALSASYSERPWGYLFPLIAIVGLLGTQVANYRHNAKLGLLLSSVFITGMLASAAFGLYPNLLPATSGEANSLTVFSAAAAPYALTVGIYWFIPGMILATAYSVYAHSRFSGKVRLEDEEH